MATQSSPPDPRAAARLVHTVLLISVLLMVAAAWFVRTSGAIPMTEPAIPAVISILGLMAGFILLGTAFFLRTRLSNLGNSHDPRAWWRAGFIRAILIWSLSESAAVVGIILFMFTGRLLELAFLGSGGLVLLLFSTPDRLGPS